MATEKKTVKKDAKEVIKKTVTATKTKSAAKKALVVDPYAEQKKAEKKRVKNSADEFIKSEFVSEAIKQQYKDLETELTSKTEELQNLYGIEAECTEMADLVNAHNVLQAELNEEAEENEKVRKAEKESLEAEWNQSIENLKSEFAKTKKQLEAEEKQFKADLKVSREREEAEYAYGINRARILENDDWEDQKSQREKVMSEKETDLEERIKKVETREAKMDELEAKVASIPEELKKATEEGKSAGKKEAETSHVFEKRALEKNAECEKNILNAKLEAQEVLINDLKNKVNNLETKLDAAYTRNQELASTVAKNSGNIKVVSSSENTNK